MISGTVATMARTSGRKRSLSTIGTPGIGTGVAGRICEVPRPTGQPAHRSADAGLALAGDRVGPRLVEGGEPRRPERLVAAQPHRVGLLVGVGLQVGPDLGGGELDLALGERQRLAGGVGRLHGHGVLHRERGHRGHEVRPLAGRHPDHLTDARAQHRLDALLERRPCRPRRGCRPGWPRAVSRNGTSSSVPTGRKTMLPPPSWDGSVMRVTPARDPSGAMSASDGRRCRGHQGLEPGGVRVARCRR